MSVCRNRVANADDDDDDDKDNCTDDDNGCSINNTINDGCSINNTINDANDDEANGYDHNCGNSDSDSRRL